jgi:hypothetical protein|tara:strand:- start:11196 stop:11723 length:528 start_codon:yes stop_codon:yes gene_type:complete
MNFLSKGRQSTKKERMLISKRIARLPCDMTYNGQQCVLYYPRNNLHLDKKLRNYITFKINIDSGTKQQTFILPSMNDIRKKMIMDNSYDVVTTKYTTINSHVSDINNNQSNYHNKKTMIKDTNRRTVIPTISDLGRRYHYIISLNDTLYYQTRMYRRLLAIITNTGSLEAIAFLQ